MLKVITVVIIIVIALYRGMKLKGSKDCWNKNFEKEVIIPKINKILVTTILSIIISLCLVPSTYYLAPNQKGVKINNITGSTK